jgi:hypothetical protein
MRRSNLAGRPAHLGHLLDHLQATCVRQSGMLVAVHPVGFLEDWVFGDFQSA